jgi:hypothetical protein
MIVFKYGDTFFCYLCNPKCGTHTFYRLWYCFLRYFTQMIYFANSLLNNSEYSDYKYYHCNLEGAIHFFKERQIDLKKVVFFTTIRNPFERVLSNYWYNLKFSHPNKLDNSITQQEDFNTFVLNSGHFNQFEPKNFRFNKDYNVYVLRLENWDEDFEMFSRSHNFPQNKKISLNKLKLNESKRSSKLEFNDEIRKYILYNYSMDFIDGKYDVNPN